MDKHITVEEIITDFHNAKALSADIIKAIQDDGLLRKALCDYFNVNSDRDFAIALLDQFILLRLNPDFVTAGDDLMLAGYILGKHKQVQDCLKIWEAKKTDFDAFCYIDIQLMVYAGVQQTLDFLQNETGNESALEAFEYVKECKEAGDFNNIDTYFEKGRELWFV